MHYSRRSFLAQAAGLATALTLQKMASAQAATGGVLNIGSQSMRTLNPAIQPGNATGVPGTQLFAGLVQLDRAFAPVPYLAKSWEVSKDGLEYRFNLVDNAVFHDGKPIKASDVVFSLETVKASHPLMSVTYGAILESVKALDDHTISIRVKKPFVGLFGLLTPALTPIMPEHVFGKNAGAIQTNPANNAPIGSGPYKFVEWRQGEHLILERHAEFFRSGQPHFDRLVFKLIEDSLTKALSMEKGDIDYLPFSFLRVNDLKRLSENEALVVTSKGYEALGPVNYLELNLREAPFNDIRVRQAIAHAIDKDFISKTLHKGMSRPLDGPLHSGSAYFARDALTRYPFDLNKANQLLDEAGLVRKSGDIRIQLTLDVPTFEPDSMQLVADYLKSQLRRVGIDVQIRKSTDLADWSSKVGQWNYQMTMNSTWNWSDPVVGVNRSFLSSNIKKQTWTNTEGYSNPKVDELLTKAATENDPARRKEMYAEFQKIVSEDLAFIWTNEGIYTTVYNKKLANVSLSVFGALAPFDEIRLA
ncbi:ABC transporter substrate-binding protein [Mesorhizobium sp. SP-1A]|uniref:ABC transporter substrate-binding protein n=1 Tax=Mesorhizobium sp. SP-1A TaxID=3077840 RepID=UPI0028F72E49|nr:ABC transporter substrate-binding protein [Mesorhizobium sp. SP-1A]